jgi:hypothetical protein
MDWFTVVVSAFAEPHAQTTLPGLEPGPSVDGTSPNGQGGVTLPRVDETASPPTHGETGRRAGHLPACKGSVDPCLPGHALARNSRQAPFACHPLVYQGEHPSPRSSTPRLRAFPDIGTPASQPDAKLSVSGTRAFASPRSCIRSSGGPSSFRAGASRRPARSRVISVPSATRSGSASSSTDKPPGRSGPTQPHRLAPGAPFQPKSRKNPLRTPGARDSAPASKPSERRLRGRALAFDRLPPGRGHSLVRLGTGAPRAQADEGVLGRKERYTSRPS